MLKRCSNKSGVMPMASLILIEINLIVNTYNMIVKQPHLTEMNEFVSV